MLAAAGARARRPALPHRLADLRHLRLRGGRAPGARRCTREIRDEHGVELPELDLGGGLRHRLHDPGRPADPARHRRAAARRSSSASAPALGLAAPAAVASSPAGRSSGRRSSRVYEVGTVKASTSTAGCAHVRLRRRRHERQHPHRAVRRRLHRARSPPAPRDAAPMLVARGRQALREPATSWSRTRSLPGDLAPGDLLAVPATGAYCRAMASNYNHVPAAAGGRGRATGRAGCSSAARPRTTCWPLDVG